MMTEYQYSNKWIHELENAYRWQLYYQQINLLHNRIDHKEKIVEIGVGTKFTYHYLKSKDFDLVSIDIDKEKKPDIVYNIVDCDDSMLRYDVVIAFNVFEHIPYDEFIEFIRKCFRNHVQKLFIGLPLNLKILIDITMKLPRINEKHLFFAVPRNKIISKHHFWELNYKQFKTKILLSDLSVIGYRCIDLFQYKTQAYFYFHINNSKS